jgi:hypothetical protein
VFDGVNDYVIIDGGGATGDPFTGVGGSNPPTIAAWIDPNDVGTITSWGTDEGSKSLWSFLVTTASRFL